MTTLTNKMDALPKARRRKVEQRAHALIAEEMSLRRAGRQPARDS